MFRDKEEELRRLEEALLEDDTPEEEMPAPQQAYAAYNNDDCDVDLEEYSQEVYEKPKSPYGLWAFLLLLMTALLCLLGYCILRYGGYLS